jgi:hypothetical protein
VGSENASYRSLPYYEDVKLRLCARGENQSAGSGNHEAGNGRRMSHELPPLHTTQRWATRPCCDDSSGEPDATQRWGFIPEY